MRKLKPLVSGGKMERSDNQKVAGNVKKITVTQKQMADALGLTTARIAQLVQNGVIVRDDNDGRGAVYLYESVKRYWQGKAPENDNTIDFNLERAKREAAERRIAELKLARMENGVYDAADVELAGQEITAAARAQLQGLPSKVAPIIAGKNRDEIYAVLAEEIDAVLNELAAAFSNIGEKIENDESEKRDAGGVGSETQTDGADDSQ